jgi:hypothetical protein
MGGALFFLFQHYSPDRLAAIKLLELVPWDDRVLCVASWFTVSLVLLSLVMVMLGKLIFLATGNRGGNPQMEITASSPEKPSGWELGIARLVPFVSANLSWAGADFILPNLDSKGRELLSATQRGWLKKPQRCIVFEDFTGLSRAPCIAVNNGLSEVLVYPKSRRPEPMADAPKLLSASDQSHAGGKSESDRTESREYIQGEPMRHMLWRIAARTGNQKRYIRVPETAGELFFRVVFVPGGEDEPAAQFADFLLRENPWGINWIFSIAGGQDTWEPGAFPEARKALARSAKPARDVLEEAWAPRTADACVYLAAADPRLSQKFAKVLDPAKCLFLLVAELEVGSVVAELAGRGFNSILVTMVD